jgi:hypothetical protein
VKLPDAAFCAALALAALPPPAESDCTSNRPPVIVPGGGNMEVPNGQVITFHFTASDPDAGDVVTLRVVELPNVAFVRTNLPVSGTTATGEVVLRFDRVDSGLHDLVVEAVDPCGARAECRLQIFVVVSNDPPDCGSARPSVASLWPPNGSLVAVNIVGVTDPNFDAVTITALTVTQDEPLRPPGQRSPCGDAIIINGVAFVRAERDGNGNGRVYRIAFEARDALGATCEGVVQVCVPRDPRQGSACIDDDQSVVSTGSCGGGVSTKAGTTPSRTADGTKRVEGSGPSTWGRVKIRYR